MRIKKVKGNGQRAAVSGHRQLYFIYQEKIRFSGGEMVFHRLEIIFKATNVAENKRKILDKVSRHPRSYTEGQSDLGTFLVPSLDRDSEAERGKAIIFN